VPLDPTPVPDDLRGLRIALLVSGGIAAYKVVDLASALAQAGCEVRVAMTPSAMRFVGPPSFQGVTGNPVLIGMWAATGSPEPHVFLGDWAQLIMVAPATANVIGRIAGGRSDDAVTAEPIAPVSVISNYTRGKMGFALAAAAADRGAKVILITTANHPEHHGVDVQRIDTSSEMLAELRSQLRGADLLLMAAAVGDFRPAKTATRKIRREGTPSLTPELEPIPDLIGSLAGDESLAGVFRIAFAAEDSDLDTKGMEKMKRKGVQAIVANDLSRRDIGFGRGYNACVLLFADASRHTLVKS